MSLNNTPNAERVHIGIFGKRNAGKSSLINAITGQNLAIVSEVAGTTTDPVSKAMEILPLGPVVIIDTAGLDDIGNLGNMRVQKSLQVLNKTDIAIIVVDMSVGITQIEVELINRINGKNIPYIIVFNKADIVNQGIECNYGRSICVSAKDGTNINNLKEMIATLVPQGEKVPIVSDIISQNDVVVLVIPIDNSAPKGRIILPQQQVLREVLDCNAMAISTQVTTLKQTLDLLNVKPKIVITDSQAFKEVAQIVPDDVTLTSFSILFARHKGELAPLLDGADGIDNLQHGDRVLISEGCTHHRQCNDIGSVKIPNILRKYTGKELQFEYTSGTEFPVDLSPYKLIVHCGGCMLNQREMKFRIACATEQQIPIVNYGMLIAKATGILDRSLSCFNYYKNSQSKPANDE